MKVETILDTYDSGDAKVVIRNVWNAKNLVEIEIVEGGLKIVRVHARELEKAIRNATDNEVR
jgi:hypothetical protein